MAQTHVKSKHVFDNFGHLDLLTLIKFTYLKIINL